MVSMAANHLWQSTVFAAIAALLAFVLRKNQARTRYWLWLIASVKFLIPFSVLVAAGKQIEWSAAPKAQQLSVVMAQISRPFAQKQPIAAMAHPALGRSGGLLTPILFSIWVLGFLAVAALWSIRWQRIRAAARAGSPLALAGSRLVDIPVLLSPGLIEPGVFGIFRPVLLLPQGIANHLTPAQLDAVIAHEMCHVRRRDNLTAALHMLVEAVFWFHPLVWWLGARLVEERERACDEEVLRHGNEPEVYAESILKTCQFYLESPLECVSGITGSDLKKRIVRIMTQGLEKKLSFWRKLLLASAGVAALAGPIVLGLMNAPPSRAQTQTTTKAPAFEVASIKPNHDLGRSTFNFGPGGRVEMTNLPLQALIREAYRVKDSQIVGAPNWINSQGYNIEAKMAEATFDALRTIGPEKGKEQIALMLQSLLADRFKLMLHHDTKEMPVYVMLVTKNGPKFKEVPLPSAGSPSRSGIWMPGRGHVTVNAAGLPMLAEVLSMQLGKTVLDQTGLKANYSFELQWTPEEGEGQMFKGANAGQSTDPPPPPSNTAGPTIFTAMEEQLGLKLESRKSQLEVLMIDHVERPSEN